MRKLIINFGDTFAEFMPTLRSHIASASLDEARRLAHTLKGVAGALEISAVSEAAGRTEDALAKGDLTLIEECLDRLEGAILPALAAATTLKGALAPVPASVTATVDYTASTSMSLELRELLERRSLRARATFDMLEQTLGATPEAERLRPVKAALGRLDYREALNILDKLMERCETASPRMQAAEIIR